jgi:ribosomal protein S18 acetylase RimI-like enzyme
VFSVHRIDHHSREVSTAVQALTSLAYEQEASLVGVSGDPQASKTIEDIEASEAFYIGAYSDRQLAGVLSIGRDDEPQQLCITLLVVHPSMQRRGVGTLLVREALARAEKVPFAVVVAANNAPALALYSKLGFVRYRQGVIGSNDLPVFKLRSAA